MDFAPMPSQHFGHLGTALSPFDMRHMSSALPDYSQQRYIQSQPQHQFSQSPSVDPNLAYSSFPNQPFTGHSSGHFASQPPQPQLQRGYPGYNTNMQNNPSEMQSRGQIYMPQQQMGYGVNIPQQPQYPSFAGHQGQYGQIPMSGYQTRMGGSYQMPRLQVESPHMASGNPLHTQQPYGTIISIRCLNSC